MFIMCRSTHCVYCFWLTILITLPVFADDQEKVAIEEIIITTHPLSEGGAAQAITTLSGDELASKLQGSLGETVSAEPGIHSASFGAAVGRPVIHGLGGARVKTTQDRIDSLDVSVTSSDHAVSIEPFIADRINILKGASTLLYGSGAIGGVVDVETGRIAKALPDRAFQGRAEIRMADNADARTAALRLDGAAGDKLAWHLDAFSKEGDDYEIPGPAKLLPGSAFDSSGTAAGVSYISNRGYVGVSVSEIDAAYGLVVAEDGGAPGTIELEQTRFDFDGHLDLPFAGFSELNVRFGVNDYQHLEIEGSGEIGTVFENDAWEGRFELAHDPLLEFNGQIGLQLSGREFSAIGEEAFVPPVESDTAGLFWLGERNFEQFDIEAGARLDRVKYKGTAGNLDFSTVSASLGIVYPVGDRITLSGLLDLSSRAPAIEELFSNGPHLATQSFEVGDTQLEKETATALTFTANYQTEKLEANVTLYSMQFDDFIYQQNTGEFEDDLPLFLYRQNDARFIGLDFEAKFALGNLASGETHLALLADFVNAEIKISGNQNLPRIPPARFGAGLEWNNQVWSAAFNIVRVSGQNDIADFELASAAYDDISLRINRRFLIGENELDLTLHGRNLGDDEQRHHASFIKDFAPAPGRRVELGVRYQF